MRTGPHTHAGGQLGIAADVILINAAQTDPAFVLKLSSTRGGTTAGARWRKQKAMRGRWQLGLTKRGTSAPKSRL